MNLFNNIQGLNIRLSALLNREKTFLGRDRGWSPFILLLLVGLSSVLLVSCAQEASTGKKKVVKECVLPDEQTGTLSGRWKALPIPISFKQGEFNAEEMKAITDAADTWNAFYQASSGIQVLDYGGDAANPTQTTSEKPGAVCSQGIISEDKYTGHVAIYKMGKWPYSNHDAIALTSFCPLPAKPVPQIYMAMMEVNYQDFFVEGKKLPDLQSIFIHEFGHLLGLDHSCDTKKKKGFPDCTDPNLQPDYYYSVLFPIILFDESGYGETRHDLNDNDMGRANCLYQGTETGS